MDATTQATETKPETNGPTSEEKQNNNSANWLETKVKSIGGLRDGVLTCAGLAYLCGYLVWSYTAWRNHLGFLPALQAQYFLAGLVPTFALLAIYVVLKTFRRTLFLLVLWLTKTKVSSRLFKQYDAKPVLVSMLLFAPVLIVSVIFSSFLSKHIPVTDANAPSDSLRTHAVTAIIATLISLPFCNILGHVFGLYINLLERRRTGEHVPKHNEEWQPQPTFYAFQALTVASSFLALTYVFIQTVYPLLPQEFGGVRPRRAYLDIKRIDISQDTRNAILPEAARRVTQTASNDLNPVARSLPLDVYYTSTDFLLVRPHGASVQSPVYQIKKDVMQGVTWCDYEVPIVAPLQKSKPPPLKLQRFLPSKNKMCQANFWQSSLAQKRAA